MHPNEEGTRRMDAERIAVARTCLDAAQNGSLSFPEIIGKLADAGFEGYAVDYRCNTQTCYLPAADSITLALPRSATAVAALFDSATVASLVRWAPADGPDYSSAAFSLSALSAFFPGFLFSFPFPLFVFSFLSLFPSFLFLS